jgi:hypothetical protein
MKTLRKRTLAALCGACLLVFVLLVSGCGARQDVALARRVLVLLIEGRDSARHLIDWEKFVALQQPVGEQCRAFAGEQDRLNFQRSFIDSFRSGFKTQGGAIKNFVNWRVVRVSEGPPRTTQVAADIKDKDVYFLFDIEHGKGGRKLVRIEAMQIIIRAGQKT